MKTRPLKLDERDDTFKCRVCDRKCAHVESPVDWNGSTKYRLSATCGDPIHTLWHDTVTEAINGWNTINTEIG
jgi:hypothetical protein